MFSAAKINTIIVLPNVFLHLLLIFSLRDEMFFLQLCQDGGFVTFHKGFVTFLTTK